MNRIKTGFAATGGLLAIALAISPTLPAVAGKAPVPVAPESASLAAVEQSNAARAGKALGLASGEKLIVKSVVEDANGATHVRYDRTINGLRVIGGDLVAHKDARGAVSSVTYNRGRKGVAPASFTPALTRSAAQAKGLAASKAALDEKAEGSELVVYGRTRARASPTTC